MQIAETPAATFDGVPVRAREAWAPLESRLAARLLLGALLIGLLTQLLFFGQAFGINVLLGSAALLVAARLARRPGVALDRLDIWLPAAALVFAAFVALRADPALIAFDLLAALALTGAGMAALGGVRLTVRRFGEVIGVGLELLWSALARAGRLAPGLALWLAAPRALRQSPAWPFVLGLLIALPFLGLFSLLFSAADAVFARLFRDLFGWSIDLGDLPFRLALAAIGAWLAGGLLVFVASRPEAPAAEDGPAATSEDLRAETAAASRLGLRIDPATAAMALLVIDLLFAIFVALQAAYLFGGRDTLADAGLTYSEYARRGFFELIAVAVVAGGLILCLDALLARRTRLYAAAAVALALLTAVILLSATVRLALYQQAYGWTELRFYALAAIAWLALGLVIVSVAVLSGRTRWVLHALVMGVLAVAVGVNIIGPQAFVADANLQRALHPELVPADGETALDAAYLGQLGDDAVPVLASTLSSLSGPERDQVRTVLRGRLSELQRDPTAGSWPSFNLARARARQALEAARPLILP
jgi:hypothetical protein